MEQELQLWDDTRSQVIQFYLAKTFRRGNQNKTKLLYHFRIGQIDPETNSLKSVLEILNRESHLEDWDSFSRKLRDIIIGRSENAKFAPRDKDIALSMDRILATPQVETVLSIDGVAYLLQTPEITGHIDLSFRFWTTVDFLRKFQAQLHQILQNREFRSNVEILPEIAVKSMYSKDKEAAVTPDTAVEEDKDEKDTVQEPTVDNDVVKKAKPSTEMLIKVEESMSDDEDSVEVEDWEEEDLDEFGGDDLDSVESEKPDQNIEDETSTSIEIGEKPETADKTDKNALIIAPKIQSTQEAKKVDETSDKQSLFDSVKTEISTEKPAVKAVESKKEENTKPESIEIAEKEEKPKLKRRPRTPKAKADEKNDDEKKDEDIKEAPKKRTRAKKATAEKKPAAKKTTNAKNSAKKPATRKPRKTKKDEEEKKPETPDDK
ncbi:MAG: hypothetical protein K8S87_01285 [Planctomycetes bacterium]|nr:hypothetical protein [Planctomycetota bacterium]